MKSKAFITWAGRWLSCLVVGTLGALSSPMADTGIGVFTDSDFYFKGQNVPKVWVSGFNTSEPIAVDVHIGLVSPSGTVYEYPNWNTNLTPWLRGFRLPEGFRFPATEVFAANGIPGGLTLGIWRAAAALTVPGTLNVIALETAPFSVLDPKARAQLLGNVSLDHRQTTFGADMEASGLFIEGSGDLESLFALVGSTSDQPPLEQCELGQISADVMDLFSLPTLDGGQSLTVSGNQQSVNLPRDPDFAMFGLIAYVTPDGQPPTSFYQPGNTYRFQGSGGADIGPFTVSLAAPMPLVLSQPALSDPAGHDASNDLVLKWNGNNGVGNVLVDLWGAETVTLDAFTQAYISCRFADDGHAVISAALLTQLLDLQPNGRVDLEVYRFAYTLFDTESRDLDLGEASISAGTLKPMILQ